MKPYGNIPPPRDSWQSALDEAAEYRNATFEEHYRAFEACCRLAEAVLARHPDREVLLARQEPLPAESLRLIRRLQQGREQ